MKLIESLRAERAAVYVATAGGGHAIHHALAAPPGASDYLAGGIAITAKSEFDGFVGFIRDADEGGYVSTKAAVDLAIEAYMRACSAADGRVPIGVGMTAATATTRELKGGYRAHYCVLSPRAIIYGADPLPAAPTSGSTELWRDIHNRTITFEIEDGIASALNGAGAVDHDGKVRDRIAARPNFEIGRRLPCLGLTGETFFPGSFDPLHDGHRGMVEAVENTGMSVVYMIEAEPPHKAAPDLPGLLRRVAAIRDEMRHDRSGRCLVTFGKPLFADKAELLAPVIAPTFVVGTDTLARMFEPRWYGPEGVDGMLRRLGAAGTHFLVFEREGFPFIRPDDRDLHGVSFCAMNGHWPHSSSAIRDGEVTDARR